MCDVSCEVSILVALFIVPSVNMPLRWTCELIKVDGFHVVVNNHNVWLLRSHTELRRDRTTPWCCVPWQVTVHCVLVINGVHNVVDHTIVSQAAKRYSTDANICGLSNEARKSLQGGEKRKISQISNGIF